MTQIDGKDGRMPKFRKNAVWGLVWLAALFSFFASASNQLSGVDFRRGESGSGILSLTFKEAAVIADFKKQDKSLAVTLTGTDISDELIYILDVADFATPVRTVETYRRHEGSKLVLTTNSGFSFDYRQRGNVLEVEIGKPSKSKTGKKKPQKGKPISINFQDIPVRSVLQIIAEHNDFNLVVSDNVSGNVTLRLDGVPWPQVLDIILQVKGLDKRKKGNVVMVAPKSELDAQDHQAMVKIRQKKELASLRSEIITVNYAKAAELAEILSGQGDGVSLLSARGSVSVDNRTNSLVLRDLADNIKIIKNLIKSLDIPVRQVEIEARIVTVDEGTLDEIGVRWGIVNTNGDFTAGSSIEGNMAWEDSLDFGGDGEADALNVEDFLNVNLGATSAAASSIAFQVAKLGKNLLLDLELSALQSESRAEIISSPRLLTTDKMPAFIEQGTELPYLEASSSGAASVSFKKAVLSLSVTPQITPDNKLVLDLSVTQDKPGATVKAGNGEAVAINTQRIGTQVLVNNGETVVLGGIYQHEMVEGVDQVPLLGDIPVLGALFRRNYDKVAKRELLIFVTPKIVLQ